MMLSSEGRQTPRPRPPAQLRRSGLTPSATDGAPPPPYALEFPLLQEGNNEMCDPVTVTAMMMGMQLDADIDASPVPDVSEKTRDELANLFLQAEKIIRARETELTVAANLGKSLLETNEALKLRHDALLSRLPAMQPPGSTMPGPSTPTPKPRSDAWTTDDDVPSSAVSRTHSRANSLIGSVRDSPVRSRTNSILSGTTPSPRRGHARRISASPSALIALSETNAELIAELTRLRTSTDSAQVEGARRLKKLKREIGGLKAELDASQRTNAELEEKVKEQVDEERRRERDERVRKLRLGSETRAEDSDEEIRDFAPPGSGVDTWDSVTGTPRPARQVPVFEHSESESEGPHSDWNEASDSASASSVTSSRGTSRNNTITPGEYAVVAQLYRKVEELQEANAELGARNRVTSEQLARAELEALEIKRVYEEIGEEIAGHSESEDVGSGTIRASSSLSPQSSRNVTPKANSWSFRSRDFALAERLTDETPKATVGSHRALGNKNMYRSMRTLKSRKPLTDTLFAPPVTTNADAGLMSPATLVPSRPPASKSKSRIRGKFRPKVKSAPIPPLSSFASRRKFSGSSYLSGTSMTPGTSVSSFLSASASSFATLAHHVGRNTTKRSLGSELGDEFGEGWGISADASEYRNLFDDDIFKAELEELEAYAGGESDEEIEEEEYEDPALAALRHALSPPFAGRLLEQDEHILPVGALQASPGEAFQLVAHAVAVRPNRWLESDDRRVHGSLQRQALTGRTPFPARTGEDPWETTRYPDIEPGPQQQDEDERGTVRMLRRDRALGRMASTANARRLSDAFELVPSASQLQAADYYPRRNRGAALVETIKRTSTDALIELWIFLQFVVVICTFIYTMSKRGPREVLRAPPRRAA